MCKVVVQNQQVHDTPHPVSLAILTGVTFTIKSHPQFWMFLTLNIHQGIHQRLEPFVVLGKWSAVLDIVLKRFMYLVAVGHLWCGLDEEVLQHLDLLVLLGAVDVLLER